MQESRRQFVAALTAGVTGTLAGCGGTESTTPAADGSPTDPESSTDGDTSSPTAARTSMDTDTPTSMATDAPAATPTSTPAAESAQVVSVGADGFRFAPSGFEIAAGETVRWEWAGNGHNVKPDSVPAASGWSGTAGSAGTTYNTGHTYSYTFDTPGDYSYYCAPHQSAGMRGSFSVRE